MPRSNALPYPLRRTVTTRAPAALASSGESSVLPLSATITSPATPSARSQLTAFATQIPTVSASFRHGRTIESSSPSGAGRVSSAAISAKLPIAAKFPIEHKS